MILLFNINKHFAEIAHLKSPVTEAFIVLILFIWTQNFLKI